MSHTYLFAPELKKKSFVTRKRYSYKMAARDYYSSEKFLCVIKLFSFVQFFFKSNAKMNDIYIYIYYTILYTV